MGDVGILSMLQGQDNWAEKRASKARELQYASLMSRMAEQDLQQQQLAGQQAQEYMNAVGKLKLLDPAIERVRKVNDELVNPIMESLRNAGGDIKRYMLSGGINQLQQYKEKLMNNPTVQKDLMSAYNYNRYSMDMQAGLTPRGNAGEDYQKYSKGEADYFGYGGGYQAPDLNGIGKYFGDTFGADQYTPQSAKPYDVYLYALQQGKMKGMNQNDAEHFALTKGREYEQALNNGAQPYMFKSLDPAIKAFKQAQANYYAGKANARPAEEWWRTHLGNSPTTNYIAPDNSEDVKWNGSDLILNRYQTPISTVDVISNAHGIPMKDGVVTNSQSIISKDGGKAFSFLDGKELDFSAVPPSALSAIGEGYVVDINTVGNPSVASKNNNPGNLVFVGQEGATKSDMGFKDDNGKQYYYAKFSTPQAGREALKKQIALDAGRGMTFEQFIKKYAPTDKAAGNDSKAYADAIRKRLNFAGNPLLQDLDLAAIENAIPQIEGQGTPGQNAFKGSAYSMTISEAGANALKYKDTDGKWKPLEGVLSNYKGVGMKKSRHPNKWMDMDVFWDGTDHTYTFTSLMRHSSNPQVATQIAYQTKGTTPQQYGYYGSAMDQQQEMNQAELLMQLQQMSLNP